MKKILFVATITRHIVGFHEPYLKYFKEKGYEVHVASNGDEPIPYCDKHFNLNFARFPIKFQNWGVYQKLKKIIEENQYEIIHCHTPVGGVVTRLAARKARKKYNTKVIYTVHGFHFFKGAPLANWLIFYPIEKLCARWTDSLITINEEDYQFAKRKLKKINHIEHINGIGMNEKRFNIEISQETIGELKETLGIDKDTIVMSYVAELNKNKNQKLLIEAIEKMHQSKMKVKLLLIGDGNFREKYLSIIKEKQLEENILLLGIRQDVPQLLSITNIYVASSIREGLPVNVMEAMYMGLPIIATHNRGHNELIKNEENGFLIKDANELVAKVNQILSNKNIGEKMKENSKNMINKYLLCNVIEDMKEIYANYIEV